MPKPLQIEQTPDLAGQLMRLRGETMSGLSKATGIRMANISVWLRNRPQTISEPRVVMLLDHLGVRNGALRTDIVHIWTGQGGSINDIAVVLDTLLDDNDKARTVVYGEEHSSNDAPALLRIPSTGGDALVWTIVQPGLQTSVAVNVKTLGYGNEILVPWLPNYKIRPEPHTPRELRGILADRDPEVAAQLDAEIALEKLKSQAQLRSEKPDVLTPSRTTKKDLDHLHRALSDALGAGVPVAELIATITRLREEMSA